MDGHGEDVADAHDGAHDDGSWAEMGDFAEFVEGEAVFAHGVFLGVAEAEDMEVIDLEFDGLSGSLAGDDGAGGLEGGAGLELLDIGGVVVQGGWSDELEIGLAASVVEFDEGETGLGVSSGADPAGDGHGFARHAGVHGVADECALHVLLPFSELLRYMCLWRLRLKAVTDAKECNNY